MNRHVEAEIDRLQRRQSAIKAAQGAPAGATRLRAAQAEYDDAFRALGVQAPPAERHESEHSYRGRLAAALAPHSETFRSTDPFLIGRLPAVEQQLRDEVVARANDPHRGSLRRVDTTEDGGVTVTRWHGDDTRAWMAMFMTPYQIATDPENTTRPVRRYGGR